ncbi:OmpA family protein [Leisingera aquaemixtae]|uniref:OmpA family protein n=1 Tax=Leisingera aquaemixtae TaxID=1396826 RepID=UPI0021A5030E|nr:OmpA family protein [Leisingera aquaemixtae]UWQ47883.1 OmpA family protein [Leisingera aquaemixtae]
MLRLTLSILTVFLLLLRPALASGPFEHGWQLNAGSSAIRFISIKKGSIAESSRFAAFSGSISEQGDAEIRIALDSVDTSIDLRNVRMRFLFFETFTYPEATITARIGPDQIADLAAVQRKQIELPVTLSLHGIEAQLTVPVAVTLLGNDRVAVATVQPVILKLEDFALNPGREKLEEAAGVTITPVGLVSLDLLFDRTAPGTASVPAGTVTAGAAAALEASGDFSREACTGRFEILSQGRSVNFAPSTARLDASSRNFLDSLSDIIRRCPGMIVEVGGHTDSQGKAAWNMQLSEKRAAAVNSYLLTTGIPAERLVAVGYGETTPLVPNNTAQNRAKNRRIEFKVLN